MERQTWKEKKLNKNNADDVEDNSDQDETCGHGSGLISVKFEENEKQKAKTSTGKKSSSTSGGGGRGGGGSSAPSCQADRCGVDLGEAKIYHRRHKVCEFHSKAAVVVVCGLRQRFCQQCSRFHEVAEFDDTKRSCRRRLAGHNERRRKSAGEPCGEGSSGGRGSSIGHSTPATTTTTKYQMATAAPARNYAN